MRTSEQIDQLAAALSAMQAELPQIVKSKRVSVPTRGGGTYSYNYAPFDATLDQMRPTLNKHGLSFIQMPGPSETQVMRATDKNGVMVENTITLISLTTRIVHVSGQWSEDTMTMPVPDGNNPAQAYGSGLTYARRYAFEAAFGIATEEDTDAASPKPAPNGSGKALNEKQRKQFHALGKEAYGPDWDNQRAVWKKHFGVASTNDLTGEQLSKLIDGMKSKLEVE